MPGTAAEILDHRSSFAKKLDQETKLTTGRVGYENHKSRALWGVPDKPLPFIVPGHVDQADSLGQTI